MVKAFKWLLGLASAGIFSFESTHVMLEPFEIPEDLHRHPWHWAIPVVLLIVALAAHMAESDSAAEHDKGGARGQVRRAFIGLISLFGARRWYEANFVLGKKGGWRAREVRYETLAHFIARGEQIRMYFEDAPRRRELAVTVVIGEGYLVDRFLLWGIMDNFKDDWQPAIDEHHQHMDAVRSALSFEDFRRSQFICWLLWGPSIPSCDCVRWRTHTPDGHRRGRVAWQFGFGDENNSVFLCLSEEESRPLRRRDAGAAHATSGRRVYRVLESRLKVNNPALPPFADEVNELAGASNIREQSKRIYLTPAGSGAAGGLRFEDQAGRYYTAYVWIMFVCLIVPEDARQPIQFYANDRLRKESDEFTHESLLPFFVHANNYDQQNSELQENSLVTQALAALRGMLHPEHGATIVPRNDLLFVYAGAVDDSLHAGMDPDMPRARIRARLDAQLAALSAQQQAFGSRITTVENLLARPGLSPANLALIGELREALTPCHFPDLFDAYYRRGSRRPAETSS